MARAGGLKKLVGVNLEEIDAREINSIPMFDDVVVRVGRRTGRTWSGCATGRPQRANLPDDLPPDELTPEVAEQLFAAPQEGRSLGVDPLTGNEIVAKDGRYGPYVTEILPDTVRATRRGQEARPSRGPGRCSRTCRLETVTLEEALQLLTLPRVVGSRPRAVRRSPRRTGATGRTSRRARTRGR